jgi:ribosomal protein L18E
MKNLEKKEIIEKLYKNSRDKDKNIYSTIAKILEKPTRNEVIVNINKINKLDLKNIKSIVVPGKVLGSDKLNKDLNIYAFNFSDSAKNILKDKAKTLDMFCSDDIDYSKTIIIK